MIKSTFTLGVILIVFMSHSAIAQWTGSVTEATKVATPPGAQDFFLTIPDGAGGSIVAWTDNSNGNGDDLYIDNLSSNGTLLWSAANSFSGRAVCTAAGDQSLNDLIRDASGNIFIAWEDSRDSDADIYVQKLNSSGVAQWTANGVPVGVAANDQTGAVLTSDGAGGVIVTWTDLRNDPGNEDENEQPETYVQRISSNGTALWAANGIAAYGSVSISSPNNIIPDGSGGAIITMTDARNSTFDEDGYPDNLDVYVQRISANGTRLWGTTGMPVCVATSNQIVYLRNMVTDGNGGAIIYWYDYRNDLENGNSSPSNADVYAQRINSSGAPLWTANGITVSTADPDALDIKVISDGAGGAIVSWVDQTDDGSNISSIIKTQRTNASGMNLWPAGGMILSSVPSSTTADLASDNIGGVIYTWSRYNGSGSDYEVIAQRINMATTSFSWAEGGVTVAVANNVLSDPKISTSSTGEGIVVWTDYRNQAASDADIYATKLNSNGTLPLHWGEITANLRGNDAVVQWETLQETNTRDFVVERSLTGVSFESISTVNAAGNSTIKKKYVTVDRNVLKFVGKSLFYRIKQSDLDGKASYSPVAMVSIPKDPSGLKLMSNPVRSIARLLYMSNSTEKAFIKLIDMNGQVQSLQQVSVVKGSNQFEINVEKLSSGVYTIQMEHGDFKQSIQVVK